MAHSDADYAHKVAAESKKWGDHLKVEAAGQKHAWLDHPRVGDHYRERGRIDGLHWRDWAIRALGGTSTHSLDLGCGAGGTTLSFPDGALQYAVGVDVSEDRIAFAEAARQKAGRPGHFRVEDVNAITLPARTFDLVFSSHSFHHFLELEHIMGQVRDALTPDGLFVLEEFVGPTLAERIAHGAIPLEDALPIARQIAEALDAAHEQGIVHRDLKPANIKLRPDGVVKVLDFGLAKALGPEARSTTADALTHSPTLSAMATGAGVILGTAAYMSPEQAKGHAADRRSDVWAFGCVLYEMLTGMRLFAGGDVSETLAQVLMKAPDWTVLPVGTPPSQPEGILRVSPDGGAPEVVVRVGDGEAAANPWLLPGGQVLLFTLAKGSSAVPSRWETAQVVAQSLDSGERRVVIDRGSDARYLPTGHLGYAVSGVLWAVRFDVARLVTVGSAAPIVEGVRRGGTTGVAQFSVSTTGSLVYVPGPVQASSGLLNLALVDRTGQVVPLKLPPGEFSVPRLSPDGTRVAFQTDDGEQSSIWIYELSGETQPRRLTLGGGNRYPTWSADGRRVAYQSNREGDAGIFWQLADGTGPVERLTRPEAGTSHVPDAWSPNGETLLFEASKDGRQFLWSLSLRDRTVDRIGHVEHTDMIDAVFPRTGSGLPMTLRTAVVQASSWSDFRPAVHGTN